MLSELFIEDRRLRIEHKKVLASPLVNLDIIKLIDHYLTNFAIDHNLSITNILQSYNNFISCYSDCIEEFITTGKYPYQLGRVSPLNRIDYDIALILSPVVTLYRHIIIKNLIKYFYKIKGNVVIVGVGSGLELELITQVGHKLNVEAYDLSISHFVKNRFKTVKIFEQEYTGSKGGYDHIFAIELLEHLSDPLSFSLMCKNSLNPMGYFITTTATNVPQIDHIYNFVNEVEFENQLCASGLVIIEKEMIKNDLLFKRIEARNNWYIFKKIDAVQRHTI